MTSNLTFEEKVNVVAQMMNNNISVAHHEMFPFGSPSQGRRAERSLYLGKLAVQIRREVQPNIFAQFAKK